MKSDVRVYGAALGPARIYAAAGRISEDVLEREENLLGETENGSSLRYEYRTRELLDTEGRVAAVLRFGERMRVKGVLEHVMRNTAGALAGGRDALSVLLVCPLPSGEKLRLYAKGGASDGAYFELSEGGRIHFDLLFCGDLPVLGAELFGGGEEQ